MKETSLPSSVEPLSKYLATRGVTSRRKVVEWIKQGLVQINGAVITNPATRVHSSSDEVKVKGELVRSEEKVYILLNKPLYVLSSVSDDRARKTVTDLVSLPFRLYPVGRLDYNSTGLILLTNDGDLAYRLTHPKFHIPKTYEVVIDGIVDETSTSRLRNGVLLDDGMTLPTKVEVIYPLDKGGRPKAGGFKSGWNAQSILHLTLYEGRKRQIRRMCQVVNLKLLSLKRISMGPLQLGDLAEGKWRNLTEVEVNSLIKAVN